MTTSPYPEWNYDVAHCRRIHRYYGRSYYFATRFLPPEARQATHVLYAWMRVPDNWVDEASLSLERKQILLQDWANQWHQVWQGVETQHPVLRGAKHVFDRFGLEAKDADAFLSAMKQDLTQTSYDTYADLEQYMYGSAGVVGKMMSQIIGCQPEALAYATKNGYAMQLTNFLRDVGEDIVDRNRIYLPRSDCAQFGVTEADIKAGHLTDEFIALMKFQIKRARDLYREAEPGISLLEPPGRKPVLIASRLYARILDKIEENQYDVFTKRARTSWLEKVSLSLPIVINHG